MTPEEIEESKKKIEERETPLVKKHEIGYRGWKLKFNPEGEPRLGAVVQDTYWEPEDVEVEDPIFGGKLIVKQIKSDWREEVDEPFKKSTKGLYSLKSLEEVKSRYGGEDIYGAIIPSGKVASGSAGFRAEKAQVRALFRGTVSCYICRKLANFFVHNDERFPLCERCLKRVEKLIRQKGLTSEEVEDLLQKLAEIYGAEVVDTLGEDPLKGYWGI